MGFENHQLFVSICQERSAGLVSSSGGEEASLRIPMKIVRADERKQIP